MASLTDINLTSLGKLSDQLHKLVENKLWLQVIIGMFCGVAMGVLLGPNLGWVSAETSVLVSSWLAFPGHLFLALIQMIVVPLVLASVVRGLTAASSMAQLKLFGLYGGLFFLLATAVSSAIGIAIAQWIDPASFMQGTELKTSLTSVVQTTNVSAQSTLPSMKDIPGQVVGLLPNNPLATFSSGDMLRIVVFALVFGVALMSLPAKKSSPLYDLLGSLQEVCMAIVGWAMRIAPLAVFGLMTKLTSAVGVEVLSGMLVYVLTVIFGLLIVALLYLLIASTYLKKGLGTVIGSCREVLLLAFSTSSSAAVMPLTIKTLEEKLNVNSATVRFLVPLGATINMSGTALYQSVATVFLAGVFDVPLDTSALVLIVSMTIFASMGSPAAPGASIVILAMMLENIGIPQSGMALLLGVDRILDMCRTVVNVLGDITASVVVDKLTSQAEPLPVLQSE